MNKSVNITKDDFLNYLVEKRNTYYNRLKDAQRKRDIDWINYYMERIEYVEDEINVFKEVI